VLDFGETKPLSANGSRGSHWTHAALVRSLRHEAILRTRIAGIPACERVAIELHYAPKDRRRRDPFNLVPTLKPIEDGIVDAGVIPDDTPDYSVPTVPVIDPPTGKPGRVYVIVRELTPISTRHGA
jgi:crossover junction endodeoxyribonuclease RusA